MEPNLTLIEAGEALKRGDVVGAMFLLEKQFDEEILKRAKSQKWWGTHLLYYSSMNARSIAHNLTIIQENE